MMIHTSLEDHATDLLAFKKPTALLEILAGGISWQAPASQRPRAAIVAYYELLRLSRTPEVLAMIGLNDPRQVPDCHGDSLEEILYRYCGFIGAALMQRRPALAESRLDVAAPLIKGVYKHEQYRDAIRLIERYSITLAQSQGNPRQALSILERLLRNNNGGVDIDFAAGKLFLTLQDNTRALEHLEAGERVLAETGGDPALLAAFHYYMEKASPSNSKSFLIRAVNEFAKAEEPPADYFDALLELADDLANRPNRLNDAHQCIDRAERLVRNDAGSVRVHLKRAQLFLQEAALRDSGAAEDDEQDGSSCRKAARDEARAAHQDRSPDREKIDAAMASELGEAYLIQAQAESDEGRAFYALSRAEDFAEAAADPSLGRRIEELRTRRVAQDDPIILSPSEYNRPQNRLNAFLQEIRVARAYIKLESPRAVARLLRISDEECQHTLRDIETKAKGDDASDHVARWRSRYPNGRPPLRK